jgi:hypothetical protein
MRRRRTTPHDHSKLWSEDIGGFAKNDACSELEFVELQAGKSTSPPISHAPWVHHRA